MSPSLHPSRQIDSRGPLGLVSGGQACMERIGGVAGQGLTASLRCVFQGQKAAKQWLPLDRVGPVGVGWGGVGWGGVGWGGVGWGGVGWGVPVVLRIRQFLFLVCLN